MARGNISRQKERSGREAWRKRRANFTPTPFPRQVIKTEQLGLAKVSDRLSQLVKEYDDLVESDRASENLMTLGVIAWNASLESPENRQSKLIELLIATNDSLNHFLRERKKVSGQALADVPLGHLNPDIQEELSVGLSLTMKLLDRKLKLFPNDTRTIVDFWFEDDPDRSDRTFKVLSSFPQSRPPS